MTVNEAPTFRSDQMPYGGVKDSGNTREGPAYAVHELTEQRVVVIDLGLAQPAAGPIDSPRPMARLSLPDRFRRKPSEGGLLPRAVRRRRRELDGFRLRER